MTLIKGKWISFLVWFIQKICGIYLVDQIRLLKFAEEIRLKMVSPWLYLDISFQRTQLNNKQKSNYKAVIHQMV